MPPIQFGILMVPYQTIDVAAPLDVLTSCSKDGLKEMEAFGWPGTAGITEKAIDIKFHHINDTMDPVTMTGGVKIHPTTTIDNCPELDYLLVGGPDPANYTLSDGFADFLRKHVKAGKGLFTTCTGGHAIACSGVLDGKNATTNHGAVDFAKKMRPQVNWNKEKRWVVDGNIWTAGGAIAGMDMMAHWVIENYGLDLIRLSFVGLDYHPKNADGVLIPL